MNPTPLKRSQLTILLLGLMLASLACNMLELKSTAKIIESGVELCYTADRSEYIEAANQVGQTIETPQYPENAVYEVCHISGKVTSVRMMDGDPPPGNSVAGNEENGSIPAGIYSGEFYYNEDHADNDQLMANEITVSISNSGIVSGSANLQLNWTNTTTEPESCTHYFEKGTSYTITGQLDGVDQESVEVQKNSYQIIEHTPCGESERTEEACSCQGSLTVADGKLKIRCESESGCGVALFAEK